MIWIWKYTSLHERDLHLHWHDVRGLKGCRLRRSQHLDSGDPERYVVPYGGSADVESGRNEMYNFFKAVKPDIIVSHQRLMAFMTGVNQFGTSARRLYAITAITIPSYCV